MRAVLSSNLILDCKYQTCGIFSSVGTSGGLRLDPVNHAHYQIICAEQHVFEQALLQFTKMTNMSLKPSHWIWKSIALYQSTHVNTWVIFEVYLHSLIKWPGRKFPLKNAGCPTLCPEASAQTRNERKWRPPVSHSLLLHSWHNAGLFMAD